MAAKRRIEDGVQDDVADEDPWSDPSYLAVAGGFAHDDLEVVGSPRGLGKGLNDLQGRMDQAQRAMARLAADGQVSGLGLDPVPETGWQDFEAWYGATSPENVMELVAGLDGQPVEIAEKAMDSARFSFYDGRPVGEALALGGFVPSADALRAVIAQLDREQRAVWQNKLERGELESDEPEYADYLGALNQLVRLPTVVEVAEGAFVEVPAAVMDRAGAAFYRDPEVDTFRDAVGADYSEEQARAIFQHLMQQRLAMEGLPFEEGEAASYFDESQDAAVVWAIERGLPPPPPIQINLADPLLGAAPEARPVFDEYVDQQLWGAVERGMAVDIARPGPADRDRDWETEWDFPDWWDLDEPETSLTNPHAAADLPSWLPASPELLSPPHLDIPEERSESRADFDFPALDLDL